MKYVYDDGGRSAAGYKGKTGDCVARAISIASGRPYTEVYDRLAHGNSTQRATKKSPKRGRTVRFGINTGRKWFKDYMTELGFHYVATMSIGSGCTTHLKSDELPSGRLVVKLTRHMAAVIDGELRDTYDCSRDGTRCVYGYWILK